MTRKIISFLWLGTLLAALVLSGCGDYNLPLAPRLLSDEKRLEALAYIEITKQPDKMFYVRNEPPDWAGLIVTGFYGDQQHSEDLTDIALANRLTGFDSTIVGDKIITATVGDYSASFKVIVYDTSATIKASRGMGTATTYYASLFDAVAAGILGTPSSPDVITILSDIELDAGISIAAGKHLAFTVPNGFIRKITRQPAFSGLFFEVQNGASLAIQGGTLSGELIIDGGAVWSGGDADWLAASNPPDPAHGATNTGPSASAPLITVSGGTLILNDRAVVQNNAATAYGGGVAVISGNLKMTGGSIKNNQTAHEGGAIRIEGNSTFTMTGGVISGNKAAGTGSGILVADSFSGTINMEGGIVVEQDNDIYLGSGKIISITGNLSSSGFAARLTPGVYSGVQVLDGFTAANHGKFTVTPPTSPPAEPWFVNSSGNLAQMIASDHKATGGTVTFVTDANGKIDEVHTFTSLGVSTLAFDPTPNITNARALIVGGGGGGGGVNGSPYSGAGGGAGGFVELFPLTLSGTLTYSVTVGGGGAAGSSMRDGYDGVNSEFNSIIAYGGGGGAYNPGGSSYKSGNSGGSGGGGARTGGMGGSVLALAQGQGYGGGTGADAFNDDGGSGGGGGAGGAGISGSGTGSPSSPSGNGGLAKSSDITGTLVWYAGGGASGKYAAVGGAGTGSTQKGGGGNAPSGPSSVSGAGNPGAPNTGGGGAGGRNGNGGAGGSGIVIVRFPWNW